MGYTLHHDMHNINTLYCDICIGLCNMPALLSLSIPITIKSTRDVKLLYYHNYDLF